MSSAPLRTLRRDPLIELDNHGNASPQSATVKRQRLHPYVSAVLAQWPFNCPVPTRTILIEHNLLTNCDCAACIRSSTLPPSTPSPSPATIDPGWDYTTEEYDSDNSGASGKVVTSSPKQRVRDALVRALVGLGCNESKLLAESHDGVIAAAAPWTPGAMLRLSETLERDYLP
jgi:hypothetical protein